MTEIKRAVFRNVWSGAKLVVDTREATERVEQTMPSWRRVS